MFVTFIRHRGPRIQSCRSTEDIMIPMSMDESDPDMFCTFSKSLSNIPGGGCGMQDDGEMKHGTTTILGILVPHIL